MVVITIEMDDYVRRWWLWFAVALFLLIPLDLFTTLLAVARYRIAVEANPVMRWLLHQGLFAVTVTNLVVVGLVVYLFHAAIEGIRCCTPVERTNLVSFINIWLGILIAVGLAVNANNLLALI